jgi:hypothetical protein
VTVRALTSLVFAAVVLAALSGCFAGPAVEPTPAATETFVQPEPGVGVPIRVVQRDGVGELTIENPTFNQDAPGVLPFVPEGDRGYLLMDATWTTVEGKSSIVANYWIVRDSAGVDGIHFFFVDETFSEIDLPAGESITGQIAFEIAPGPYTFIVFDDNIQEVARFTFEAGPREGDGVRE